MTTRREVAADVVVELAYRGVFRLDDDLRERWLPEWLGIEPELLDEAVRRRWPSGWKTPPDPGEEVDGPPLPLATPEPVTRGGSRRRGGTTTTAPRPEGMRKATKHRPQRLVDGVLHYHCPGDLADAGPHWAPVTSFRARGDKGREHLRVHCCTDHEAGYRSNYYRQTRVAARVLDGLSEIGLLIELDERSNLIGVCCKECKQPFQAGDVIEGEAAMRHQHCGTPALDPAKVTQCSHPGCRYAGLPELCSIHGGGD